MLDIESAWDIFCDGNYKEINNDILNVETENRKKNNNCTNVNCTNLYISTKTKMLYLNTNIDLNKLFWDIEIIPYHKQLEGIIKKQMKFSSHNKAELELITEKTNTYKDIMVDMQIIKQIDTSTGRTKFKDVRKITIGLSKKDIISYRKKKKGAFINCFIVILRVLIKNIYNEIHVKIFNTGKIEIPGIQDDSYIELIMNLLISTLNKYNTKITHYFKNKTETILINSNFSCNFYINRNKLYDLLTNKYNINCSYDPCSYPGIQCEYYYDKSIKNDNLQNGKQKQNKDNIIRISFMIFRTGSILIVGKCNEHILKVVYEYVKNILINEKKHIFLGNNNEIKKKKKKKSKYVKKIINISNVNN